MKRLALIFTFSLFCLLSYGQYSGESECEKRLRADVEYLSADSLRGRFAGTEGETAAARYLYSRLKESGVQMISPESGEDFYIAEGSDTVHSRNVAGIVEGYDELLKSQYVLIGANLDHIGTNTLTIDGRPVLQIYPGANDNASGIASIIEIARRVASSSYLFRRSVIFAGFGAKEKGMAGSWYFANRAFGQADSISLMVNVVSVGRLGPGNPFTCYTGIPSPEIYQTLNTMSDSSLYYMPVRGTGYVPSSDYLSFYEKGIPFTLFTAGAGIDNRTLNDVAEKLDYESMDLVCDFIFNFIKEIANRKLMIDRIYRDTTSSGADNIYGRIYSPREVDKAPSFFKGDEKSFLQNWVYTYLKYPEISLLQGIQGVVVVEFIVEKDGRVTNVKAVSGGDASLEEEAVRVVSASPKWKPAVLGGEKVRVRYSLPVEFRLKKKK